MFEARLLDGPSFKKLMEAIKDLVNEANFEYSSGGLSLQAMDSSHVSLVSVLLKPEGFSHYRADRKSTLGVNLTSMSKILKCSGAEDVITLSAEEEGDLVNFMFEAPNQSRISQFSLKLMDIDTEQLQIPDTDYKCVVNMPSTEFQRIVREIGTIGDTVLLAVTKDGVQFSVKGDLGSGNVVVKQRDSVDDEKERVQIKLEEDVSLKFALRYLNFFAKATPLSAAVTLRMSPNLPLMVEYKMHADAEVIGHVSFYLAPKFDDEATGETQS